MKVLVHWDSPLAAGEPCDDQGVNKLAFLWDGKTTWSRDELSQTRPSVDSGPGNMPADHRCSAESRWDPPSHSRLEEPPRRLAES